MLRRIGLCRPSSAFILSRITPIRCSFNKRGFKSTGFLRNTLDPSSESSNIPPPPSPPVHTNLTAMTIFTLLAVGTIYTTSAVWENLHLKKETPKFMDIFTRDRENVYDVRRKIHEMKYPPGILWAPTTWPPVNQLFNPEGRQMFWEKLMPSEKFTYTVMATNIGIHTLSIFTPALWSNIFMHIPGTNRNFTLLTCIFGHGSLIHLGFNMYGFHSFMPTLGQDPTFKSSIAHMTAFYLSTGVISSWAQASSARLRPNTPPVPFLGASGAVFALIGAFALQHPEAQFQIMFIPYPFAAQELLGAVMLFDLLGMFGAFKTLRLGHAAHLSGALLGLGYVYFDGEKRIWSPLCRSVYKSFGMKKWENKV
ncbi:75934ea7-a716-4293-a144-b826b5f01c8d [Sclerotinia trifoliorum]|uniref:75934ea7-a716-4293-a144-b826b5f01c8d n=1 Tax=Sclerotinia trifoliorum TaxID=28548 RepID=A0A8H2ZTZ6_9HELO|nr:75934ea7-a716-4293-a144-b826b5f01c8d [Sclerotinia trifoliorum]